MHPVLTAADLERVPEGGEVAVAQETLIPPLARDEAERRGITFRTVPSNEREASGGVVEGPGGEEVSARVVAIGADHGGFELKEQLKVYLRDWGYKFLDLGTDSTAAVDYPDFAEAVANALARGDAPPRVVVESARVRSSISPNKVARARAALCYDP